MRPSRKQIISQEVKWSYDEKKLTESIVTAADGLGGASRMLLALAYKTCQICSYQEFPPTPITEMGSQVRPTRPVTSWTLIPSRAKMALREELFASWVLLPGAKSVRETRTYAVEWYLTALNWASVALTSRDSGWWWRGWNSVGDGDRKADESEDSGEWELHNCRFDRSRDLVVWLLKSTTMSSLFIPFWPSKDAHQISLIVRKTCHLQTEKTKRTHLRNIALKWSPV